MSNIFNIYLNINETNNPQNIHIYLNTNPLENTVIHNKINIDIINNNETQEQIIMNNNDINNETQEQIIINNESQEQIIINNNDTNNETQEQIIINNESQELLINMNNPNIEPSAPLLTDHLQYMYNAPPLLDNMCYETTTNKIDSKIHKYSRKCSHYNNNIMIYATCCNKYFDCYKCHNEKSTHKIFSHNLTKIKCLSCNHDNKFSSNTNSCDNCKVHFSKYYCKTCCVWDNRMTYHCHKCNVCKYGNKNDSFHCNNCNLCIKNTAKDRHKCNLTNKDDDCSICLEKLFPKTNNKNNQITFLNCGHILHFNCYHKMISLNKINCPLCRKKF
jgi:uncharacterized CHY-type Zn-finger protein